MTNHYVIVGATSDLGTGLAWRLAALGFHLLLIDRDQHALAELSDQLSEAGHAQPLLAAIDPLHHDFEAQCRQLAALTPPLTGFIWAGAWLDNPTPLLQESLAHWQKGMLLNITYPLMIYKSVQQMLTPTAKSWFAQPQAIAFTNQLGAATALWSSWLPIVNHELGYTTPKLLLWQLPRIADRVHRRIFPLSELSEFTPIDTAIDMWLLMWMNDE